MSIVCTVGVKWTPSLEMNAPHQTANIAILATMIMSTWPAPKVVRTPKPSMMTEYCSGRDARNVTLSRRPITSWIATNVTNGHSGTSPASL